MNVVHEHIAHPERSYRFMRLELDAFGGERHRHRQIELTWIEQGSGLRQVGDSVQPFVAGDLVLLGPNVPHAWTSPREHHGQPHVASVLQFAPELLDAPALPELAQARGLVAHAARGLWFDGIARDAITQRLARLTQLQGLAGVGALFDVLHEVQTQRGHATVLSAAAMRVSQPRADQDDRIARIVAWVHQRMAEPLGVHEAAAQVHISPAAFSRFFRRELGKTFTTYVNDVRCSAASIRLRSSDKPIARIAAECGFDTLSHFNQQFRTRMGCTPREFRAGRG